MIETIGHYVIDSQIGRGGMGVVFKAHEPSLNRTVAVKLLGEHLAKDMEFVKRFQREAQSAAALNHPNIVQIYTFGEEDGHYYFAMEYVDGVSVQDMIKSNGRLDPDQAAHIIMQAAQGLAAAHDMAMIHRDIKPANLMVNRQGVVKITDFGIALCTTDQTRLTSSGMLMGTPGYLSPEQCLGKDVDARTDIYALGVSLYEMLTGQVPFNANSPAALIREIVDGRPQDLSLLAPDLPHELRRVVELMMDKDPDQRYQSCHEIAADLAAFLQGRGVNMQATANLVATYSPGASAPGGGKTTPIYRTPTDTPMPSKGVPVLLIVAIVFVAITLLSAGGYFVMKSGMFQSGSGDISAARSGESPESSEGIMEEQQEGSTGDESPDTPAAIPEEGEGAPGQEMTAEDSTQSGHQQKPAMMEPSVRSKADASGTMPSVSSTEVEAPASSRSSGTAEPSPDRSRHAAPAPPNVVMVVALGDPLLGNSIVQDLERALDNRGLKTGEAFSLPEVDRLVDASQQGGGDVSGVLAALSPHCTTAIIARVKLISDRQLQYYGHYDTAWTSDVTITAYDTVTGSPRGKSCRQRLEYTTIGVDALVENDMKECRDSLISQIP
ncbi:MAG TPA: protein kinase [Thermoanaerobaculia bacterium]|nr:protein kinase [Thermoanaerobaculia bacterium]HUM30927.1 protein kinase [Thermoanaerobaculia bacterium]HXK69260.1 protein kinase [Thermoanaerobaculia bacterium]